MSDDKLTSLNQIETPAPSPEARRRALDAALMAFDAETAKESSTRSPRKNLGRASQVHRST